jgi:hypothetical protein
MIPEITRIAAMIHRMRPMVLPIFPAGRKPDD